jgi:hypothetical protein
MSNLSEVVNRAIADYGFRQGVLWGAEDAARQWELSPQELSALQDTLIPALEALPIPVEPANIPTEQARFADLIRGVGLEP